MGERVRYERRLHDFAEPRFTLADAFPAEQAPRPQAR